jgi:hypothetical protein
MKGGRAGGRKPRMMRCTRGGFSSLLSAQPIKPVRCTIYDHEASPLHACPAPSRRIVDASRYCPPAVACVGGLGAYLGYCACVAQRGAIHGGVHAHAPRQSGLLGLLHTGRAAQRGM